MAILESGKGSNTLLRKGFSNLLKDYTHTHTNVQMHTLNLATNDANKELGREHRYYYSHYPFGKGRAKFHRMH